jgi:hypothetical protein
MFDSFRSDRCNLARRLQKGTRVNVRTRRMTSTYLFPFLKMYTLFFLRIDHMVWGIGLHSAGQVHQVSGNEIVLLLLHKIRARLGLILIQGIE